MKKIYALVISLVSFCTYSQDIAKSVNLGISKNAEVFQVVEEDKKQISLFFSAKVNVLSIRFDENFNVIDSLKAPKPSKEYDDIVGYSLSGNKYYAYWSNSNGKELIAQGFDFGSKNVTSTPISIPLDKERIIKKITVNNVFYIVSIIKNTGILNFYVMKDGLLEKKSIDLTSKRFLNRGDQTKTLWDLVSGSTVYEAPYSFQTIATETPPSLALSANKHKIYVLGNKLMFTLDDNCRFTQTFTVDLSDFSVTTKMFNQPTFAGGDVYSYDSNSFYMDNKMVLMKNSSDYMKITVKDMEDKPIKEFLINNDEISFKNSEINQENGSAKSVRVLDKSSQLLRKINGNNPAISLYEANGNIYMIIGGVSNVQQNNSAMMFGGMYGMTGVLIGMALTSNYSLNNLNSYKQRKVVYINCLFDKDFNHIPGEVKKTSFDEVRIFSETKSDLIAPVLFRLNSNLYYAGYDKKVGNYIFYKFKD